MAPPPFYKLYKHYSQDLDSAPSPPPPIQGPYVLYGSNYTTDDVLPGQGIRQSYPKGPNIGKHTIFGRVCRGMEILKRLGSVQTDNTDRPIHDVKILRSTVRD